MERADSDTRRTCVHSPLTPLTTCLPKRPPALPFRLQRPLSPVRTCSSVSTTRPSCSCYADGFAALPLDQKRAHLAPVRGGTGRSRHLLRPAVSPQPGDARLPGSAGHPRSRAGARQPRDEVWRYTKLFWLNSGGYNNLTARKFVMRLAAEALVAAAEAAAAAGARFRTGPGEPVAALARRLAPCFLDVAVDPMVTSKTPGDRRRHPARQRQQPLRRRDDGRPRRIRGALPAELAAGEARRAPGRRGVPRRRALRLRAVARGAAPRGGDSLCHAVVRRRARRSGAVVSHRGGPRPHRLRHRLGEGHRHPGRHHERLHRGLHGRPRHQGRLGGPGLLRERREDLAHPAAGRTRPMVRGPDADRPGLSQAGRAGRDRHRHRRRGRGRRFRSDHPDRRQPAQRSARPRAAWQQVGHALERDPTPTRTAPPTSTASSSPGTRPSSPAPSAGARPPASWPPRSTKCWATARAGWPSRSRRSRRSC